MECLVHYMSNSMTFEYVVPIEFESFLNNSDRLLVCAKLTENAVNPIKKFPFRFPFPFPFRKLKQLINVCTRDRAQ